MLFALSLSWYQELVTHSSTGRPKKGRKGCILQQVVTWISHLERHLSPVSYCVLSPKSIISTKTMCGENLSLEIHEAFDCWNLTTFESDAWRDAHFLQWIMDKTDGISLSTLPFLWAQSLVSIGRSLLGKDSSQRHGSAIEEMHIWSGNPVSRFPESPPILLQQSRDGSHWLRLHPHFVSFLFVALAPPFSPNTRCAAV